MRHTRAFACAAALAAAGALSAEDNLARNGDFEQTGSDDQPAAWDGAPKGAYVAEGGNHYMRFKDGGRVTQKISIKPEMKALLLSAKMKVTDLVLGAQGYEDARLNAFFKIPGDEKSYWCPVNVRADTAGWVTVEGVVDVKPGADTLVVEPCILCKGVAEYDDIKVVPLKTDQEVADARRKVAMGKLLTLKDGAFEEGKFDKLTPKGMPVGWEVSRPEGVKVVEENGAKTLVLTADDPKKEVKLTAKIKPEAGWKKVKISGKTAGDIKKGAESWSAAKVQTIFNDFSDKKLTEGWPGFGSTSAAAEWKDGSVEVPVPAGEGYLSIEIGLFGGATGTYKVQNLKIEPVN